MNTKISELIGAGEWRQTLSGQSHRGDITEDRSLVHCRNKN